MISLLIGTFFLGAVLGLVGAQGTFTTSPPVLYGLAAKSTFGRRIKKAGGHLYIGGHSDGAVGTDAVGGFDIFVRKYPTGSSTTDTPLWTKMFGTSGTDYLGDFAVDASGNVFAVGMCSGTVNNVASLGSGDACIFKLDNSGAIQCSAQFGGTGVDRFNGVALDETNGYFYVSGNTTSATFDGTATVGIAAGIFYRFEMSNCALVGDKYVQSAPTAPRTMSFGGVVVQSTGEAVVVFTLACPAGLNSAEGFQIAGTTFSAGSNNVITGFIKISTSTGSVLPGVVNYIALGSTPAVYVGDFAIDAADTVYVALHAVQATLGSLLFMKLNKDFTLRGATVLASATGVFARVVGVEVDSTTGIVYFCGSARHNTLGTSYTFRSATYTAPVAFVMAFTGTATTFVTQGTLIHTNGGTNEDLTVLDSGGIMAVGTSIGDFNGQTGIGITNMYTFAFNFTGPSVSPTKVPTGAPLMTPTALPSSDESASPSAIPTVWPSFVPSWGPSQEPSTLPSADPSAAPSLVPTNDPSAMPSATPSARPSAVPSETPSALPTVEPSELPSVSPSETPSAIPSADPSALPTGPSVAPSAAPSNVPSASPSAVPSVQPTLAPSVKPTEVPTVVPSEGPSAAPSTNPTKNPSTAPSVWPTADPSVVPSNRPTADPSMTPSVLPSAVPSMDPSAAPSVIPTTAPSTMPSVWPTADPSVTPSVTPSSASPSVPPSVLPSAVPSMDPSAAPSEIPTMAPSATPSVRPTADPSMAPSVEPSADPSIDPSASPSKMPTTAPSVDPTAMPSAIPTTAPSTAPSVWPTADPSMAPSVVPSAVPSVGPTASPSIVPSVNPSAAPSVNPTMDPSTAPSMGPTAEPSVFPSVVPSAVPSNDPSAAPSGIPTIAPSAVPSVWPTANPSTAPSMIPSAAPSVTPTVLPSVIPTMNPSALPSAGPTVDPSVVPSVMPSAVPSEAPTMSPSAVPTFLPTASPSAGPSARPTDGTVRNLVLDVTQTVHNLDVATYNAQKVDFNVTFQQTIAATLEGITPEGVTDIEVTDKAATGRIQSNAGEVVPQCSLKYKLTMFDTQVEFDVFRAQLVEAVSAGTMDEHFRHYAGMHGIDNSSYFGEPQASLSGDRASSSALTGVMIAGIVIGVLLAISIGGFIVTFFLMQEKPNRPTVTSNAFAVV